jgi:hypothetical protein
MLKSFLLTREEDELLPRWSVLFVLLFASFAVLVASWPYLFHPGSPYGDDQSSHFALMLHMAKLMRAGHTDFFFDQVNLGVPLFLSYQPFPATVTGALSALTLCCQSPIFLFKSSTILVWMLLPWSWYKGLRWVGFPRLIALCAGLLILAIQDPLNYGMTFKSIAHKGLYTQSFGMLFFPLAVGSFVRRVLWRQGSLCGPVTWMILTFTSHIFFGMYAGIITFLLLLVTTEDRLWQWKQALLIYGIAIALMAWWIVPLLQHVDWVGGLPWKTVAQNGWPWKTILKQLANGAILDDGRLPWLTVTAGSGLLFIILRIKNELFHRWLLLACIVTSALFLGRTNWGTWYNSIPLHSEINVMRYISGIHCCAILLASILLYQMARFLYDLLQSSLGTSRASNVIVLVTLLGSGWLLTNRYQHMKPRLKSFDHTSKAFKGLTRFLMRDTAHRFLVDGPLGTTSHFHRDLLPALTRRPQLQSYGMTFHATHSTYFVEHFDYTDAAFRLYNITDIVTKSETSPTSSTHPMAKYLQGTKLIYTQAPYRVYRHPHREGMFHFVKIPLALQGKRRALRPTVKGILTSLYHHQIIARYANGPGAITTHPQEPHRIVLQPKGRIELIWNRKDMAKRQTRATYIKRIIKANSTPIQAKVQAEMHTFTEYIARVYVQQPKAWLLLKVNHFPYWHAKIGDKPATIHAVAPNFMAIEVPKGLHKVTWTYRNPRWQKAAFIGSVLLLLLWWFSLLAGVWKEWKEWKQEEDLPSVPVE